MREPQWSAPYLTIIDGIVVVMMDGYRLRSGIALDAANAINER